MIDELEAKLKQLAVLTDEIENRLTKSRKILQKESRERFELSFFAKSGKDGMLNKDANGDYLNPYARVAWEMWQEALLVR